MSLPPNIMQMLGPLLEMLTKQQQQMPTGPPPGAVASTNPMDSIGSKGGMMSYIMEKYNLQTPQQYAEFANSDVGRKIISELMTARSRQ